MRHEAYETFNVGPFKVSIFQDSDPQSPDEWDNQIEFTTTHNRYFEKNPGKLPDSKADMKELEKSYWVFPLFMYAHSGVALSLGSFACPWDSGQVGFCLVSKPHADKNAPKNWRLRKNARKAAEGYVETWNQYLSGDVWGYVIEARAGDLDEELDEEDSDEEDSAEMRDIDSCWDFYGLEYCKQQARESAEYHVKHEQEENAKIAAMLHV